MSFQQLLWGVTHRYTIPPPLGILYRRPSVYYTDAPRYSILSSFNKRGKTPKKVKKRLQIR